MNSVEIFDRHAIREFQFIVNDFGFERSDIPRTNSIGERRHLYESGRWFIAPYYDIYEKGINVEFGNGKSVSNRLTVHMYMRLVDPAMYYQLGFGIVHNDSEISLLLDLYVRALQSSGIGILNRDDAVCRDLVYAMKFGKGMCPSYSEQPVDNRIDSRFV